jgi:flagellar biosynthesis GTPase FlhF
MFQKDFIRKTFFRSFISKQTPKKVHKILLTGGPCGGKTTMLAKL